MKIYDNVVLKKGQFFDGEEYLGCLVDDSFCDFKGVGFTFENLKELRIKIKLYFCKPVKFELSINELNELLGKGDAIDSIKKLPIKGKELVKISVKYGTTSQTLITEWI